MARVGGARTAVVRAPLWPASRLGPGLGQELEPER